MKTEKPSKHVVLVLSGKGGVGKSTVAAQLALSLVEEKKKVSLFTSQYTSSIRWYPEFRLVCWMSTCVGPAFHEC